MIFSNYKIRSSLKYRLLTWVWLASAFATTIFTAIQIIYEYREEAAFAFSQVDVIKKSHVPSIVESAWDVNEEYLRLQLNSIKSLPHVKKVEYLSREAGTSKVDTIFNSSDLHKIIPIKHKDVYMGDLIVEIGIDEIKRSYLQKILRIFLIQTMKTFFLSFILVIIFSRVILVHLNQISGYLNRFSLDNNEELKLERPNFIEDEFSTLQSNIIRLKKELIMKRSQLAIINAELEEKVENRTKEIDVQREKLVEASRLASIGFMAGGIAHEINNPLAIISGNIRRIRQTIEREGIDSEAILISLDKIDSTIERINRVIIGLKIVSGVGQSSPEKLEGFPVSDAIEYVLGVCTEKFKTEGIRIELSYADDIENILVKGDKVQLSQVLLNLLNNSYDAIIELDERWVKISVKNSAANNNVIVRISDSGSGIPAEIADKVFSPFFTTKELGKGTGLGLSLSKAMLMGMGGNLGIDKEVTNTCFEISLKTE